MHAKNTLTHTKGSLSSSKKYIYNAQEFEESQRECFEQTGDLSEGTLLGLHDLNSLPFPLFPFKTGSRKLKVQQGHKLLSDSYAKAHVN